LRRGLPCFRSLNIEWALVYFPSDGHRHQVHGHHLRRFDMSLLVLPPRSSVLRLLRPQWCVGVNGAGNHRKHMMEALEGSLKRLQTSYLVRVSSSGVFHSTPQLSAFTCLSLCCRMCCMCTAGTTLSTQRTLSETCKVRVWVIVYI